MATVAPNGNGPEWMLNGGPCKSVSIRAKSSRTSCDKSRPEPVLIEVLQPYKAMSFNNVVAVSTMFGLM